MIRSRPTVVLLAAFAMTLLAASTSAAQKPFFGVNPQRGTLTEQDFEMMSHARIGTIRIGANRDAVETGEGGFNFAHMDRTIGMAAARGIRALPVIGQHGGPRTPAQRRQMARFARALAMRYGPGGEFWTGDYARFSGGAPPRPVFAWQFFNEQNSRSHWVTRPNPRLYGLALRMVSRAITRVNRRAEIVLGGMFVAPRGRGSIPSFRYLNRLYRVPKVKRAFRTVAIHPYSRNIKGIRRQVVRIRGVMRRNGHKRAGIRMTELGWSSATGRHRLGLLKGPKGQARMLTRSFRLLQRNRKRWKIRSVIWFGWQDLAEEPGGGQRICSWCPQAGLITVNRTPKPSYRAYRRATR